MDSTRSSSLRVHWRQPTLMITNLVLGLCTAVAHHLYYLSLHNRAVYASHRQQWPIRIASALSFLAIALFNLAVAAAYTQCAWTRLRNKTFSLKAVDRLFALTVNAIGLFSKEIITRAKLAAILAIVAWLLPIATTIPPATLTVVNTVVPFVSQRVVPTLQTNVNKGWSQDIIAVNSVTNPSSNSKYWIPTAWVAQITARAAIDTSIGDIPASGVNSSYDLVFPGPALQCDFATAKQNAYFDIYRRNTSQGYLNANDYEKSNTTTKDNSILLVYSAFNPADVIPKTWGNSSRDIFNFTNRLPQYWIQTAEHNLVCNQGFAYFSAHFSWTNGIPTHEVSRVNFTANGTNLVGWPFRAASVVYSSMLDVISGTISINLPMHKRLETTGNVMLTGLRGCDEIANNYWINRTINATSEYLSGGNIMQPGMTASFPTNPWLCRNKTLGAALEDLSNNITMSLLGYELTSQPNALADIVFTPSQLIYEYHPTNLILTYAIAGFLALIAVLFGFAALDENGIAHSLRFSAIMDATRSLDLALVTNDCGLGSEPLDKNAEKTRLAFGPLRSGGEAGTHRVGFLVVDGGVSWGERRRGEGVIR